MNYFLFNHVGSYNHGCEAIIRSTENIIKRYDSDSEFVLSSFTPETDCFEDIRIEKSDLKELTLIEKIIAKFDMIINHSERYALKKMYSPIVKQAEECDICISVGGDTYCYGDNHGVQILTEELKKSGKKVVLWGASIGKEDIDERKIENLKCFDAIFARESLTYTLLKELSVNENVFLFPDPAFCLEREDVDPLDGFEKSNTIGLNVSPLICRNNEKITDIT
ncbi:MAG: polysaccharide pyruvyl transferase family protein, partial [Ruminococcus sp.]|nr:polysaccharide pyruvyl transferase family protein [Candidatus Copronaster equi]